MNSKIFGSSSSSNLLSLGCIKADDDLQMQGVSTSLRLLLKLIEDRRLLGTDPEDAHKRLGSMVGILDDVKSRIEKSQTAAARKATAELRRCNSELRSCTKEKRPALAEENQKLRKELVESNAARKNLERMLSSLGKEKEIMASELTRKAHALTDMQLHMSDIEAQNDMLLEKVQVCMAEHRGKGKGGEGQVVRENALLHERILKVSDEYQKTLDKYRALKGRYKETHLHCVRALATGAEMAREASNGQLKVQEVRKRLADADEKEVDVEGDMSAFESMFRAIGTKVKEPCRPQQQ